MIIFLLLRICGMCGKNGQCELVNAFFFVLCLRIDLFKGERSVLELVAVVRELVLARGHGVAHRVREVLIARVRRLRV